MNKARIWITKANLCSITLVLSFKLSIHRNKRRFTKLKFIAPLYVLYLHRPRFSEEEIPSIPQIFHSWEELKKYSYTNKCHLPHKKLAKPLLRNWCFDNFYQILKFCKLACLFFVLVSLVRGNERKIWGNERIYFSENPGHSLVSSRCKSTICAFRPCF